MKTKLFCFVLGLALLIGCSKDDSNVQQTSAAQSSVAQSYATVVVDAATVQQTIKGFGGANIVGWTGDLTSSQRTTAFSPTKGIGLSIVRVRVSPNSSDWAANKASIDSCKFYGGSAIATAWTAPESMKTNSSLIGGNLNTNSYAAYAAHLNAFNTAVGGVSAISPTNEPNYSVTYESMNMSATEIGDFVAAQGSNCGAPIMAPEPFNMDQDFINAYLSNSTAKSKTVAVCGHIYGKTPYLFSPGLPVWMTEHYVNSSVSGNDWATAMSAAKEIHDCMNVGWSAYVWWYIRRSYGLIDESSNITKTGYVMAHFARFVRPGYSKISCTANPIPGIYCTAYKSGTKLVIVAINENTVDFNQTFNLGSSSVTGFTRYKTTSSSNLVTDSFTANGNFSTVLSASSITTLISN